jgi:NAD(P)-dependent dehydrogenase (short-subunit alcohol dehydrogenase family)
MKVAIVTGASGNLGKAVILKLLGEGYHVTGTVVPGDSAPLTITHERFEPFTVDLADEGSAQAFVDAVIAKRGQLDVAVLTVGGFAMGKIAETKISDITSQYKLNFETVYNAGRPAFLQMIKQGSGRIFMVGSRPGADMHNSKGMVAYGLTKSLIFRLAELMNDEAKGHNVITHVLVPSTIDTPQNRKSMPDADFSKWVTAEAIAEVVFLYCTDQTSIIREPVIKVYNNA